MRTAMLVFVFTSLFLGGCQKKNTPNNKDDSEATVTASVNAKLMVQDSEVASGVSQNSIMIARFTSSIITSTSAVKIDEGKISEFKPGAEELTHPYCVLYFKGTTYQTSPKLRLMLDGKNQNIPGGVRFGIQHSGPFDKLECFKPVVSGAAGKSDLTITDIKAALGDAFDFYSAS